MISLIKSTFYNERKTKKVLQKFIAKAKQLSFGVECERFEQEFAVWQGKKECVLLNSGSSANLAIIQALLNLRRLKKGDNVGFSAVTWSTNVMPLIQLGFIPVPIDVSLATLNITPTTLLAAIKKYKIKMLFLTNLLGFCDDIEEIVHLCKKFRVLLIEDNCESLGSVYKKKKLGNFGDAATFSFYVGHHMSTVEGGAVVTDDEELATMLRLVRAHGWDRNLDFLKQEQMRKKFKVNSTFYSRYTFYDLGYNLRPTEITGVLGRYQLQMLDEIITKREKNFLKLATTLYSVPEYYPMQWNHMEKVSNFAFPILCRKQAVRDELVRVCEGKVEIRPIVGGNISKQPFFIKYVRKNLAHCPNAQLIHENGLYFGNNPELNKKEMSILFDIFITKSNWRNV